MSLRVVREQVFLGDSGLHQLYCLELSRLVELTVVLVHVLAVEVEKWASEGEVSEERLFE